MSQAELKINNTRTAGPYVFISAFTFLTLIVYAFFHTWEYDEAWTFLSVRGETIPDLLAYKNFNIANNHIINSLWFKIVQWLGLKNVLFYRALSLASFPVYAFFLYKAVTYSAAAFWKTKHDWLLILFFLPPIIFFFASGRGYAMASAFFLASLYYMKVYLREKKQRAYWFFFFAGIISSLCIVSFFYPFVAMLVYMHIKDFRSKKITLRNFISLILFAGLTLYIYHIGKTIILHDTIINGTDNLFAYGLYSTFISSLNISVLVFPFKEIYPKLGMITKIWILVTMIPLALIILRRHILKYAELIILVIMTLIFLASHIILKSKYPSDRSVIYLLHLIYIPVVLHIAEYRNKFFKLHYFSVLLFGVLNFLGFIYEVIKPEFFRTMKNKPEKEYVILSDWPNKADSVYNGFYFNNRLHFTYIVKSYETDNDLIDRSIKAAANNPQADFLLIQKVNYLRVKEVFENGFIVTPLMSSNSKEMLLIQRK